MYTHDVYTKMADLFETTIVCDRCNEKTSKNYLIKDGFKIRTWECPSCNRTWHHPADMQELDEFQKLKSKQFQVKLRLVGNSYAVSIPREIIDFEEEFFKDVNDMLSMTLESPDKLSIFFSKRMRRFIKGNS